MSESSAEHNLRLICEAIAESAKRMGIYNGEAPLDGPQFVMLLADMTNAFCAERTLRNAYVEHMERTLMETDHRTGTPIDDWVKKQSDQYDDDEAKEAAFNALTFPPGVDLNAIKAGFDEGWHAARHIRNGDERT